MERDSVVELMILIARSPLMSEDAQSHAAWLALKLGGFAAYMDCQLP